MIFGKKNENYSSKQHSLIDFYNRERVYFETWSIFWTVRKISKQTVILDISARMERIGSTNIFY
jgi:hypothetical protein